MIFSGIALYAKDKIVIHSVGGYGHLNPYEIPTVTSDGDDVTIKSDSTITDMTTIDLYYDRRHLSGTFEE